MPDINNTTPVHLLKLTLIWTCDPVIPGVNMTSSKWESHGRKLHTGNAHIQMNNNPQFVRQLPNADHCKSSMQWLYQQQVVMLRIMAEISMFSIKMCRVTSHEQRQEIRILSSSSLLLLLLLSIISWNKCIMSAKWNKGRLSSSWYVRTYIWLPILNTGATFGYFYCGSQGRTIVLHAL